MKERRNGEREVEQGWKEEGGRRKERKTGKEGAIVKHYPGISLHLTQIVLVVHCLSRKSSTWLYSLYLTSTSLLITTLKTKQANADHLNSPHIIIQALGQYFPCSSSSLTFSMYQTTYFLSNYTYQNK